ncbi:MAG: sorbosone dehydrogenase family protein, partial [Vicinamibacterales bacterium]
MRRLGLSTIFIVLLASSPALQKPLPLNTIKVPPGFRVDLYADRVENARSMALSPGGVLYVGTRT